MERLKKKAIEGATVKRIKEKFKNLCNERKKELPYKAILSNVTINFETSFLTFNEKRIIDFEDVKEIARKAFYTSSNEIDKRLNEKEYLFRFLCL